MILSASTVIAYDTPKYLSLSATHSIFTLRHTLVANTTRRYDLFFIAMILVQILLKLLVITSA